MAVSKRLRYEILKRDGFRCKYCGLSAENNELTIDHVVPVTLGGEDLPTNLAAACKDCNAGKSSAAVSDQVVGDVAVDALRWAKAMQAVVEQERTLRYERSYLIDSLGESWVDAFGTAVWRPHDWDKRLMNYIEAGLDPIDLTDAMQVARRKWFADDVATADCWRYFCGVCKGTLQRRQDKARELVEAEVRIQEYQAADLARNPIIPLQEIAGRLRDLRSEMRTGGGSAEDQIA